MKKILLLSIALLSGALSAMNNNEPGDPELSPRSQFLCQEYRNGNAILKGYLQDSSLFQGRESLNKSYKKLFSDDGNTIQYHQSVAEIQKRSYDEQALLNALLTNEDEKSPLIQTMTRDKIYRMQQRMKQLNELAETTNKELLDAHWAAFQKECNRRNNGESLEQSDLDLIWHSYNQLEQKMGEYGDEYQRLNKQIEELKKLQNHEGGIKIKKQKSQSNL